MRHVEANGSFFDVGGKFGEICKDDICEVHEDGMKRLLKNKNVASMARIREMAAHCLAQAKILSLQSVQFLRGMAEGANVDINVVAFTAFMEQVSCRAGALPPEKCSTWVVRLPNGYILIIHNEDFPRLFLGKMVTYDVEFDGGYPRTVGVICPGQLLGTVSLNARLIASCSNSLYPLMQPGFPQQVMHFHASLAHNMVEAEDWLTRESIDLTTHYVVAYGHTGEALSLTVSNEETAFVPVVYSPITGSSFCHTNHIPNGSLFRLKMPDPAIENAPSSFDRYNFLSNLLPKELPRTTEEAVSRFSKPPIFRETEESSTLVTAIMCAQTGEFWARDADQSATERDFYRCLINK